MKRGRMRTETLTLAIWKCNKTGEEFQVYGLAGTGLYGQFILHAQNQTLAYWDAVGDRAFDELAKIANELAQKNPANHNRRVVGLVCGVCCDPSPDGSLYKIQPYCPICGDEDVSFWDVPEPFQLKTIRIPNVTHKHWNRLTTDQRRESVQNELLRLGLL